jgi:sigma-B regulation protein RsbU (phosphoserine phosphatase)
MDIRDGTGMSAETTPRILVVDDEPLVLEATVSQIRMWGYRATACTNAREALDEFRRNGIGLVLSDIRMPEISGVELLDMIHELDADIPVILMTAYTEFERAIDAVRKGAFDFIIKPCKPGYLQDAIEKGIRFRQLVNLEKEHVAMLEEKMRETEENLRAAAVIQQSLLPVAAPQTASFEFAWQFRPCERVGGDLYNLFWLDETHLGVYVMDVSGHGVPAAMVTTSIAQALDPFTGRLLKRMFDSPPYYELVSPAEVLAGLNRGYPMERFGKLLTLCYLILDLESGIVRYSNAALPLPFLIRADGRVETLTEGGTIIGIGEGALYEEGMFCMEEGDRLFIHTDGIVEHLDKNGEFYGDERLVRELRKCGGDTLQAACDQVIQSLIRFGGEEQPDDDITLVGIEFRGARARA